MGFHQTLLLCSAVSTWQSDREGLVLLVLQATVCSHIVFPYYWFGGGGLILELIWAIFVAVGKALDSVISEYL